MSPKNIFICYRRDDAEGYAGRIYDRLNSRFPGHVFMDVTGITPGADFLRVIQDRVGSCHVLIAIIGRHWATVTDDANRRRLDLADDYVRHEIATALNRNITVIPVLVRGAQMPSREVLPPDLAALSRRNALDVTDVDFDHDVHRLLAVLEDAGGEPRLLPTSSGLSWRSYFFIFSLIGVLAVGAGIFVLFMLGLFAVATQNNQPVVQPSPKPGYSPSPRLSVTPPANTVNFDPVGRWIVTFERDRQQLHKEFVLYRNNVFEGDHKTGHWKYSTEERKLVLEGWFLITIESQEGKAFVGNGEWGYVKYRVRLSPK